MITPNAAEVLNLVGFVTGTALYAMLLALVLRDGAGDSRLPLATAVLGLIWNIGELLAYALPRIGFFAESIALWALSFPSLGLLAAVVVHSVARQLPRGMTLTAVAYGCSAATSLLHLGTVFTGNPEPSSLAFLLLTVCYGISNGLLTISRGAVPLALFGPRGYASLLGRLAMPILIAQAIAPTLAAPAVEALPASWTFALCGALGVAALLCLAPLRRAPPGG